MRFNSFWIWKIGLDFCQQQRVLYRYLEIVEKWRLDPDLDVGDTCDVHIYKIRKMIILLKLKLLDLFICQI